MASSCGAAGNSFKLPSQHHHRLASIKLYCLITEASNLIKPFIQSINQFNSRLAARGPNNK